jgi:crotonobetainyl-CoA:carnitine CoA-transferase CaiB-like acyl-CoA transferase
MDDPRFETGWLRTQNYEVLEPILNEAMKMKTTQEWVEELEQLGIPCGPVNRIDQVANDNQVKARGMFLDIKHPQAGTLKVVNTPFKFSRTPCKVDRPAPDLGQDTQTILTSLLSMSQTEIDQMKTLKAI